jgi:hypothetical protein
LESFKIRRKFSTLLILTEAWTGPGAPLADEETGARVTSEISSTDVKSLVQRLMRSSTSIKSDRPAWKRTSDVVAAQTADTILLERLNHLTVKMVPSEPPPLHIIL